MINTTSHTVVATIPIGSGAYYGIAVTPDSQYVYVINSGQSTASVISTATNTVTATITDLGFYASSVAIAPSGGYAYLAGLDTKGNSLVSADKYSYQCCNCNDNWF